MVILLKIKEIMAHRSAGGNVIKMSYFKPHVWNLLFAGILGFIHLYYYRVSSVCQIADAPPPFLCVVWNHWTWVRPLGLPSGMYYSRIESALLGIIGVFLGWYVLGSILHLVFRKLRR